MSVDHNIFKTEVLNFIKANENKDIIKLLLQGSPFENVNIKNIAQQIKGLQVAKYKFPNLYKSDEIAYPPTINLEQASSQELADYKSTLINKNNKVIDITGGFGIDAMSFTQKTDQVFYCEINSQIYDYANHNFKALAKNITSYLGDGIDFLKTSNIFFDWIYIDPSRRDKHDQKVYLFEDCTPNILNYLDFLKSKSKCLLIKTSPLLDLKYCINKIKYISEIHIVALHNEVKELLLIVDFKKTNFNPKIQCINLSSSVSKFSADYNNINLKPDISKPLKYLYEPHSAIMKSGLFGEVSQQYSVKSIAQHSHLYTSNFLLDFPGRRFKIIEVISPNPKLIKQFIPDLKANIKCRNYPLKPEQIKIKYKIKDGGKLYVFFTSNQDDKKIVLICEKV